ncbi:hypothetical protein G9C98_007499 [Cotesia typhae]|uniref:Bystin n=1 Tax=Cotesia typhae TaxID=2053667 RepID=A0A8J5QJH5_9HYME|nr:hypothetical protein G9C98_007499 [Cotesia typhae]
MGKAKKVRVSKGDTLPAKVPLADQLEGDGIVKSKNRNKIRFRAEENESQFSEIGSIQMDDMHPLLKESFEKMKPILSVYRSGALPKLFKFIPSMKNWEQVLYILDPPSWTAAAMYQATRIFASNLKENMAQRFYNLVLLPRVRDDLAEYKRLNFHLYQAVRKALYKPRGFMKGFLLPLLESGDCTLREAIIIGSIVAKNSIPMLESAAALLKIAEMGELPVLWHQALLTFAQRYKSDISSEQREALLELLKRQYHHTLTAEIRRELQHAKCRDVEGIEPMEAN